MRPPPVSRRADVRPDLGKGDLAGVAVAEEGHKVAVGGERDDLGIVPLLIALIQRLAPLAHRVAAQRRGGGGGGGDAFRGCRRRGRRRHGCRRRRSAQQRRRRRWRRNSSSSSSSSACRVVRRCGGTAAIAANARELLLELDHLEQIGAQLRELVLQSSARSTDTRAQSGGWVLSKENRAVCVCVHVGLAVAAGGNAGGRGGGRGGGTGRGNRMPRRTLPGRARAPRRPPPIAGAARQGRLCSPAPTSFAQRKTDTRTRGVSVVTKSTPVSFHHTDPRVSHALSLLVRSDLTEQD